MNDYLRACQSKLRRVDEQLPDLRTAVLEFLPSSYTVRQKLRFKQRQIVICVGRVATPPPEISVLAGEILHNLRGPLDYLVSGFAVDAHGSQCNLRNFAFPIVEKRRNLDYELARKLRGLPEHVIRAIRNVQPCNDEFPTKNPLYLLAEFNNTDKHQMLPTRAHVIHQGRTGVYLDDIPVRHTRPRMAKAEDLFPGQHLVTLEVPEGVDPREVSVKVAFASDVHLYQIGRGGPGIFFPLYKTLIDIRSHLLGTIFCDSGPAGILGWRSSDMFPPSIHGDLLFGAHFNPKMGEEVLPFKIE